LSGIDPCIVKHEIKTYKNVKLIRQKIRLVNLRKATIIKEEVEKILKVGFIYPIPLSKRLSNPVPKDKKKGTIWVFMDF
jgi:hypothetical protein